MRLIKNISAIALIFTLFAFNHYPSASLTLNPSEKDRSNFKLSYQGSYETVADDLLMVKASYSHYMRNKHEFNHLLGVRTFGEDFGVGFNFGHYVSNLPGMWSNVFSPGWELFYKQMQFSMNLYLPYRNWQRNSNLIVFNPTIGEVGVNFKPFDKFEFGVIPYYNFSLRKWGLNSNLSVFLSNSIELKTRSHWRGSDKSISIAIEFHFGGPKDRKNQEIRKLNVFNYAEKISLQKPAKPPKTVVRQVDPVVYVPQNGTKAPEIKVEDEIPDIKILVDEIPPLDVKPNTKSWSDFFFRRG